ncbi:MAG: hypothetical protein RL761_51, partial [Pseudomonadota bacterium]
MMPAESFYATSAFLVTGAALLTSTLLFGLWRVCKERFLLLASVAQLVFAVHQLPLFFEATVFASWFARAGFASLFGVYLGLTALVVNLLKSPPSLAAHRVLKLYLWSIVPLSFYVFGVDDFTGYVSTVYAHHRLTVNNLFALVVNLLLAAVVVRRFWLMQSQLLQARLDAGFAAERGKLTERQRIMSDIHDTVGSQLVGLLSQVRNQAPYAQLEQQTSEALQELRIAIDAIQPVDGNLASVLAMLRHRLQPRLEAARLRLIWHMDDLPKLERLSPLMVQHIQRIMLELLSNVMQHAKASEV